MVILKKISLITVVSALLVGLTGLNAAPVSVQDKKKAAERKLKRTTREATKGKAQAKPKAAQSVMQPLVVKRTIVAQQPVVRRPVTRTATRGYVVPPVEIATLPVIPIEVSTDMPSDMPTDMPAKLSVGLVLMLPSNVQNRVENIIASYPSDAQKMFQNIYLLAWVDDELMKRMNLSDVYSTLLTVISQECNVPYPVVETMAGPIKDYIDTTLTRFENAVIAGDKSNFDIQQVRNLFQGGDSYREYLERCVRLANEYKQSNMAMVLKMAIATAAAETSYTPAVEEDFNY